MPETTTITATEPIYEQLAANRQPAVPSRSVLMTMLRQAAEHCTAAEIAETDDEFTEHSRMALALIGAAGDYRRNGK